jgi:predicted amidohydrolase
MDKFTIACVQMRMRLPADIDEHREDLRRFLRAADAKRARIVLFPELAGLVVAPLLLRDRGSNLLRAAERAHRSSAGVWERMRGRAAGWAASLLKADLYAATAALLDVDPQAVWSLYADLYGGLAKSHGVTIVAPSAYLPAATGSPAAAASSAGALENRCAVFGPNGDLLGTQSKVLGYAEDEALAQKGSGWQVIATEVGQAGIVIGSDILYPEVGRLLAFQGADFLLVQGACPTQAFYQKLRAGALARMQDNQLYAAASFVVGKTLLRKGAANADAQPPGPYVGRSAIFAPQELTPRSNGVLVEMGAGAGEGVVTAEWDFPALRHLWETSDTPLRRALPAGEAATLLGALYAQLRALPQPAATELLDAPEADETSAAQNGPAAAAPDSSAATPSADEEPAFDLDMLPLLGSVTSRWPLPSADENGQPRSEQVNDWPTPRRYSDPAAPSQVRREDETDEMDAVESGRAPAEPSDDPPPA